jgi:hypothetical protein
MTTAPNDETLDGTTRSYSRTTWQCFHLSALIA